MLDHIRTTPDRWSTGLKLFFEAQGDISKFFGLTLVRDYLSSSSSSSASSTSTSSSKGTAVGSDEGSNEPQAPIRKAIRDAVMGWSGVVSSGSSSTIPPFLLNNVVSILTLCIKLDYPEHWPTAFEDVLTLATRGYAGLDLVVRLLVEMGVEIVEFNVYRSPREIAHNVVIKDAMRQVGLKSSGRGV